MPARRSVTVTTAVDSQPDMNLLIYMGEGPRAEDNFPLSSIRLECKEKEPAGTQRVRLTFYAYEHSVLRVGVRYKENESEQEISIIPASDMSEADMQKLRDLVDKMAVQAVPQEVPGEDLGIIPLSVVV